MKDKIIYSVLKFLETKDISYQYEAIEKLKLLARKYTVNLNASNKKTDLYNSLLKFILNESGYMVTLKELYNNLNK